jgi:hypothetical protein
MPEHRVELWYGKKLNGIAAGFLLNIFNTKFKASVTLLDSAEYNTTKKDFFCSLV